MSDHLKFYTLKESAEQLRVSPTTMRRWLKVGKVRAIKLGKDWRVPREALEELTKRQ